MSTIATSSGIFPDEVAMLIFNKLKLIVYVFIMQRKSQHQMDKMKIFSIVFVVFCHVITFLFMNYTFNNIQSLNPSFGYDFNSKIWFGLVFGIICFVSITNIIQNNRMK